MICKRLGPASEALERLSVFSLATCAATKPKKRNMVVPISSAITVSLVSKVSLPAGHEHKGLWDAAAFVFFCDARRRPCITIFESTYWQLCDRGFHLATSQRSCSSGPGCLRYPFAPRLHRQVPHFQLRAIVGPSLGTCEYEPWQCLGGEGAADVKSSAS